jgi:uncharacterized membrane protein
MSKISHTNEDWFAVIVLTLVYALYFMAFTAPIGFAISALKVYQFKRLAGTDDKPLDQEVLLVATHYEWLVRTFIVMTVMAMAAAGLAYYMVGFIIGGFAVAWWLYRLIRGAMALMAHRLMPAIICTKTICYGQIESA